MPVDVLVIALPLLSIFVATLAMFLPKFRKKISIVVATLMAFYVLMYFGHGMDQRDSALTGNRDAQFELGNYYWTRLSYHWPDFIARDRWWLKAAENGHPHAMYLVGHFSMRGSSEYIPKDVDTGRQWIRKAAVAGDPDAIDWLKKNNEGD